MKKLENDLCTTDHTTIYHEPDSEMKYNGPHHFVVKSDKCDTLDTLAEINFQKGPIKECEINGVFNEDLIAMVICRLEYFQNSEFKCRENAVAITKLEEALMWLRKRTLNRKHRGVLGTYAK